VARAARPCRRLPPCDENHRGPSADEAVTSRFSATPRARFAQVWRPLCLAALNTPPERASANTFAHVLRSAFGGNARDSDVLVPTVDLSACFPDAAALFIVAHGGAVRCGVAVRGIANEGDHVSLGVGAAAERFRAAIVAVGPHQLAATLGDSKKLPAGLGQHLERTACLAYESITTIYLGARAPHTVRGSHAAASTTRPATGRSTAAASLPADRRRARRASLPW
jgi:predicted NAD/FAD-binding protein